MSGLFTGLLAWTFFEYAAHRWLMHGPFWRHHRVHHLRPERRGLPLLAVIPGVLLLLPALWISWTFVIGVIAGYGYYEFFHYVSHELPINWHMDHHSDRRRSFGVTSPFWDKVFGT